MRAQIFAFLLLLASAPVPVVIGQSSQSIAPQTVEVSSGKLCLKAFLWTPAGSGPFPAVLFCHGSGSTDPAHTGPFAITAAAEKLPLSLPPRSGPFRGPRSFMQDILKREETAKGKEARQHLQFVLLTTEHLNDVTAGLSFLKSLPGVDAHGIAIVGHSFGGQLTLLAAEHESTIRAAVTFAAGAQSWESWPELRERLLTAVHETTVPVMLIHAANDYSTAPGKAMADELAKCAKPYVLKIYPTSRSHIR